MHADSRTAYTPAAGKYSAGSCSDRDRRAGRGESRSVRAVLDGHPRQHKSCPLAPRAAEATVCRTARPSAAAAPARPGRCRPSGGAWHRHRTWAGTRPLLPGPSVAVRGKPTVSPTAQPARTTSAYLHRRGDASGSAVAAFRVCGRASLCPLALIAAGSCERAAGSGGEKRPRSGAEGALDTAARERIMAGGGKGANLRRDRRFRDCLRGAFLAGTGGDLLHDGTGGRRGAARLT
jgi:hypothetical protein